MRVLGPELVRRDQHRPGVSLNASLSPVVPQRGRLGFFSQSGALGVALLDNAVRRGLGLSTLRLRGQPGRRQRQRPDAVLGGGRRRPTPCMLYLESLGNPRKFSRIARRLARQKPVVVVKSGRSAATRRTATWCASRRTGRRRRRAVPPGRGHPGRHRSTRCSTSPQLVATQPLPAGRRVAIVGNSDALAVLARRRLRGGRARASSGTRAARAATPTPHDFADRARRGLRRRRTSTRWSRCSSRRCAPATRRSPRCSPHGRRRQRSARPSSRRSSACRGVPRRAARRRGGRGLGPVVPHARGRGPRPGRRRPRTPAGGRPRPATPCRRPGSTCGRRGALVARAARPDAGRTPSVDLDHDELAAAARLLRHRRCGTTVPVTTADEAVAAADRLGYPVALKATAPHLRHRARARRRAARHRRRGGAARRLRRACAARLGRPAGALRRCRRMAPTGVACRLATVEDPLFGPVVSFGLGGRRHRPARRPVVRRPAAHRHRPAPTWSARSAPPRCCSATAAPARSTSPRWRTCSPGWPGWPTTCPRWPRSSSTRWSSRPTGAACSRRPAGWRAPAGPGRPRCPGAAWAARPAGAGARMAA